MSAFTGVITAGYDDVAYVKTGGSVDYASPIDKSSPAFKKYVTPGTGADQADIFWRGEVSIAPSAIYTLDLNGGGNSDIFGTNLAMLKLVSLTVINAPIDVNAAENLNTVTLTTTISGILAGGTPNVPIRAGGLYMLANTSAAGLATVVPTTADTITITNAAVNAVKVQICVVGRSV